MPEQAQSRAVGTSIPRVDGVAKVRGSALYVDDLTYPGMLHGATVRSRCARGTLRAIELADDFDFSGITVATADDIPGRNTILLIEDDQPALVPIGGEIRHHAQAVALVAAPTRKLAMEAAAHVRLVVDSLPAVLDLEEAATGREVLHGEDNVFKKFHIAKGDVAAGFAAADHVIEGVYRTPAQEQMYIEPQGMIARWDDTGCHIIGSLQCPYYVHKAMKELLALSNDTIEVSQSVTGGGFGGKEEYPSMIAGHAAIVSKKAGAPVKLIYDRDEDIAATTKRHPSIVKHKIGFKSDGTITAVQVDVLLDGGAYLTLSPVVLSRAVLHAGGPYRCDNLDIVGRVVATNHPPHGAFRGFGAPQTTFAYERQIAKLARTVGIDQIEYRDRFGLRSGDSTATSQELTYSVGSAEVMQKIAHAAKTKPLPNTPAADGKPEIRRGRGVAFYFHGAGFTGSGEQRLAGRATLAIASGGRFEVRSSSTDIGQGALTMFSQIAATALGVGVDNIAIAEQTTAKVPDSGPTVASRTCMVVGGLVARAGKQMREKVEAWAADNGVDATNLCAAAEAMRERQGESAVVVQYEPPPGIVWDDATYTGSAYPVYGWAACLVDVGVDMDTFEVTVERCVHAVDVGKAIHPIIVKGQIEGGTLQALGWALWENVIYNDGRVVNDRMQNCIVPTFADAPEMETALVEEPYPFGPHGAKGVGEIPMDGPAAAVANAVEDALGVAFDQLPVSPESVEAALRAEESAR